MRNWFTKSNNANDKCISSYRSYHAGKYLGLTGSVVLCLGLLTYFFLYTDTVPVVTWVVSSVGVVIFVLGAFFFFRAVYLTMAAQSKEQDGVPNGVTSPALPAATQS